MRTVPVLAFGDYISKGAFETPDAPLFVVG